MVTNGGYSDWATTRVRADVRRMWYRLSRREDDFRIECSEDGVHFKQMRICHMWEGAGEIRFWYLRLLAGGVLLRGKVFPYGNGSVQVDGP